jgi:NTE family protein
MKPSKVLWLVSVLLPFSGGLRAVEPTGRAGVGLTLEGGGALGLAHIGVLKWFEDHRIPVDYVAGTSMGGLVGGFYATGMRADDLQKLVEGIDWDSVLRGESSYQSLSYRRKEDREAFQNNLEFGLRHGLSLPGGLNEGQEITFFLDRTTLAYSKLKSFNDLPIPFRCVAADLATGKPHVFEDGPLGDALRSTMSLPAIFSPVRNGDAVYADGGLLNNLPVDVTRKMGAGLVVAVFLDANSYDAKAPQSLLTVTGRSIGIMISANELKSIETADILVSVNLAGFTASDYARAPQIIAKGYEAAGKKAAMLSRLALSEADWQAYLSRLKAREINSTPMPTPGVVEVTGLDSRTSKDIESALKDNAGKPLDTKKLEDDLSVISGSGRFSRFSYHLADAGNQTALVVKGNELDYGPPFLNLGINVNGADYRNVQFAVGARITALDVGEYGAEWRLDVTGGSIWSIGSEYYRPLRRGSRWFVAPQVSANNSPFELYFRDNRLADYRWQQYTGALDFGYAINRSSELRFGYATGYFSSSLSVGAAILPTPSGRTGVSSIRYNLDLLDSPSIPRTGEAVHFRVQWDDTMPGAPHGFALSELNAEIVRPVSRPGSVYLQAFGGTTFGYQNTGLPQFFLGGPVRLGAYGLNELRTNQYFLFRLGYLHQIFRLPPLLGNRVFLTSAFELGKTYGNGISRIPNEISQLPMDVAFGVDVETFLGPVFLGGSVGDTGHRKWYFQIGKLF